MSNVVDGAYWWLQFVATVFSGIVLPIVLFVVLRQSTLRGEAFRDVHKRLDHLDECTDKVRSIVQGQVVTRNELNEFKTEQTNIINRMRIAVSNEINENSKRIGRIEDLFIHGRRDER